MKKPTPRDWIVRFIDGMLLPRTTKALEVLAEPGLDPDEAAEWAEWIPVASPVTNEDLDRLEAETGTRLPALYREYFLYKQILDGDLGRIRMPDMRPPDPLAELRKMLSGDTWGEFASPDRAHLAPIADDGTDIGPLCLNARDLNRDGEPTVVLVDHELFTQPGYAGDLRYESVQAMYEAAAAYAADI